VVSTVVLSSLRFGTDGFQINRRMVTEFTLVCPKCSHLEPTDVDYDNAVAVLIAHAWITHGVALPLRPVDWKGNPIG
jgi:hypothetical protein